MPANPHRPGFFSRAVKALVTAREREAAAYVNRALLALDDETLAKAGYNRADLMLRRSRSSAF